MLNHHFIIPFFLEMSNDGDHYPDGGDGAQNSLQIDARARYRRRYRRRRSDVKEKSDVGANLIRAMARRARKSRGVENRSQTFEKENTWPKWNIDGSGAQDFA